jgi:hypothetical protein
LVGPLPSNSEWLDLVIEANLKQQMARCPTTPASRAACLAVILEASGGDAEKILREEVRRVWIQRTPRRGRSRPKTAEVALARTFREQFTFSPEMKLPPTEWVRLVRALTPKEYHVPESILRAVTLWDFLHGGRSEEVDHAVVTVIGGREKRVSPAGARRFIERTFPELVDWGRKKSEH